jgi:hypothetical protein
VPGELPCGAKLSVNGFGPTLSAQALNNQTHWLVIFGITGSICARALKPQIELGLEPRGHHDWPVMRVIQPQKLKFSRIQLPCQL